MHEREKSSGEGYIKLFRKAIDSRVFKNPALWQLWTWCLMRVNHAEAWVSVQTGRGETEVHVLPGQFIFGRNEAARQLKQKPFSTYKRMLKLQNMGNLNMQSNTHCSIVTILNWEKYQLSENGMEQAKEQARNNQGTTKEQPRNTNKNDKNEENDKNIYTHLPECLSDKTWKEFLAHRKAIKSPVAKESHERMMKKFENWNEAGYSPEMVVGLMVEKSWKSFNPEWMKGKGGYGKQRSDTGGRSLLWDTQPEEDKP